MRQKHWIINGWRSLSWAPKLQSNVVRGAPNFYYNILLGVCNWNIVKPLIETQAPRFY